MRKLRTMDDVPLDGKRVIVRIDLNVPVDDNGKVGNLEDYRLQSVLPTIQELQQRRCRVLLLGHRGRPHEDGPPSLPEFDIKPIKLRLAELLREDITTIPKLSGQEVEAVVSGMEPGGIAIYPNVRADERELTNNIHFGKELSAAADAYVNDAFSVCHRAHVSTFILPKLLLSAAGRRLVEEVRVLSTVRDNPSHPYIAIISGSKISTKVGTLRKVLEKVDKLCIGGALANVFIVAQGYWDENKYSTEEIAAARSIMDEGGSKVILPRDVIVGDKQATRTQHINVEEVKKNEEGIWDIGPKSVQNILNVCQDARTIMWNGPVGMFEVDAYVGATRALAQGLSSLPAFRVVGGGDTVNAIERFHLADKFDHISVGGGAMIEFIEGKEMPGLEPLYE